MPTSPILSPSQLRIWLVHDWLTGMRGGEKVLLQLTRLFPQAKIATLFYVPGATHPEIESRIRRVSFLQDVPEIPKLYRALLPILPAAIRTLELDPADLIISTSHCVAKGIRVPHQPDTHTPAPHLCYCFTPMRYIWEMQDHYLAPENDRSTCPLQQLKRQLLRLAAGPLRQIDLRQNAQVTAFAGTCQNVTDRITRCYHRPATIIYPGIDTDFYHPLPPTQPSLPSRDFYLVVSALVPYKRIDLAVQAFAVSWGKSRQLVIIGKGPEESRLRTLAKDAPHIQFLGWQSDEQIRHHYQHAAAFLFPGEEDFGLTPLESQACGTPVIAYAQGGVLETVPPNLGSFFHEQTPSALQAAIESFEQKRSALPTTELVAQAAKFSWSNFRSGIWNLSQQLLR